MKQTIRIAMTRPEDGVMWTSIVFPHKGSVFNIVAGCLCGRPVAWGLRSRSARSMCLSSLYKVQATDPKTHCSEFPLPGRVTSVSVVASHWRELSPRYPGLGSCRVSI